MEYRTRGRSEGHNLNELEVDTHSRSRKPEINFSPCHRPN